ncbi:hypothetical protein Gohar_022001 [Gossypium harknessii]|uniref:Myb/SANT-like domain-containing protein n=2 Tax=Gossypium TaxID=3633 RepID=A0A7J9IBQ3_9ROSI|nr:hypothetical protein [Gossypium harknessii]
MLKAKPNLESRIRKLKKDWAIVKDMLRGKDNSDFGWTSIDRWLLLKMLFIKKLVNSDIAIFVIMTNFLSYMQKIEPLGKMLKQLLMLLKK